MGWLIISVCINCYLLYLIKHVCSFTPNYLSVFSSLNPLQSMFEQKPPVLPFIIHPALTDLDEGMDMFVFLSKFLPLLIYPLGLSCIFIILALVLSKRPRMKSAALWAALIVLWIGGNRWVSSSLTRSLETRFLAPETIPAVEAIVVLGGGTESSAPPRSGVELNGAGDRLIQTARLYREGVATKIYLSGGNITWQGSRPSTPAEEMQEILLFMGVPQDALVLQTNSRNTYEDALYTSELLRVQGIDRIVLVTSASHMPRSMGLFEKQGIEVIPAPADFSVPDYAWQDLWQGSFGSQVINLIPNSGALSQTTASLKEYLGLLVYRLRGWI